MNAEQKPTTEPTPPDIVIPEGILKARAALRRDLPELLASRWTRGKWACHSSEGRVGIGNDYLALIGMVNRKGIPDDAFVVERIDERAGSNEEEEID